MRMSGCVAGGGSNDATCSWTRGSAEEEAGVEEDIIDETRNWPGEVNRREGGEREERVCVCVCAWLCTCGSVRAWLYTRGFR
jgi:hypothetical protein